MKHRQTFTKTEEIKPVIPFADGKQLPLSRPLIMGILNVTPDSFSDGGKYVIRDRAIEYGLAMVNEGADIIDVGGESTRPGAEPIESEEEIVRVIPVVEAIRSTSPVRISVDTYHAATARAAIEAGADIVNDISALRYDPEMVAVVAEKKVPVVLMHMRGTPRDMQKDPSYVDCVVEVMAFLQQRVDYCLEHGISKTKVIVDPGIGFGKRLSDNLQLLSCLPQFKEFNVPLLIGASRKSFIGMLHQRSDSDPARRLGGSIAAAVAAVTAGADILRVHDVGPTVEALKVIQAIRNVR